MKMIKCACGRTMPEYFHNSTIKRKQCPSCELKNIVSGDAEAVKKGLKTKRKPKPMSSDKKRLKRQLDTYWSKAVKERAGGKCEVCGITKSLNSHHIYSRAKMSTRWDVDNGLCLCVNHHIGFKFSAHKTPMSFARWLMKYKGEKFLDRLEMKANTTANFHAYELEVMLKKFTNES